MQANFLKYISMLKNLRCILYFKKSVEKEKLNWVVKKHRYRNVGVPLSVLNDCDNELRKVFEKKPFVSLHFPLDELNLFYEMLKRKSALSDAVLESVLLSSCYLSPIIILGQEMKKDFDEIIVWELRSDSSIGDAELRRHLRIAGYTILDFHERLSTDALEGIKNRDLKMLCKKREEIARSDGEKRFWRFVSENKEMTRVLYFDVLREVAKLPDDELKFILEHPDVVVSLSLSCGFVV